MTYRGQVKNGVIVLNGPESPPEGSQVEVSIVQTEVQIPTIYERYKDFIGILDGLPPDLSINHDFYIHGGVKQDE